MVLVDGVRECLVLVARLGVGFGSTEGDDVAGDLGVVIVRRLDIRCFVGAGSTSGDEYGVGADIIDDDESVRFNSEALLGIGLEVWRGDGGGVGFFLPDNRRTSRLMPLGLCGDGGASIALFLSSSESLPNRSSAGGPFFSDDELGGVGD